MLPIVTFTYAGLPEALLQRLREEGAYSLSLSSVNVAGGLEWLNLDTQTQTVCSGLFLGVVNFD
jgi:hypothetical protein